MKRWFLVSALVFISGAVRASSTLLTIVISGPASTAVVCPISTYSAPLAAGAMICTVAVTPNDWSGTLALSGKDATKFALAGTNLVVGSTALPAGTYSVTITSTP